MDFGILSKMCASSPGASFDAHPAHFTVAVSRTFCSTIQLPLSLQIRQDRFHVRNTSTILQELVAVANPFNRTIAAVVHRHQCRDRKAVVDFTIGQWGLNVDSKLLIREMHPIETLTVPVVNVWRECSDRIFTRFLWDVVGPINIA